MYNNKYENLKIIKDFLICSIGNVFSKLITILASFFTINFLTPDEFGLLSLLNTLIFVIPILFNLGLRQAFGLEFFHKNFAERKKMLNNIVKTYLLIAIPLFILFIIFFPIINKHFLINKISFSLFFIAMLICFFHFFSEITFQILRYESKVNTLAFLQISMGAIVALITFIFVYFLKFKITGIILAQFLGILFIVLYSFFVLDLIPLKFEGISFDEAKLYLKLGFPFVPSILFSWIFSFGDRWVLAKYSTLHAVGIYSLADSFSQIFHSLILSPLTSSYLPYVFKKFSNNKEHILEIEKWNRRNMYFCMLSMFLCLTIGFFSCKKIFYFLIPAKYYESINYIYFVLVEQIIFMGSYFATCYLQFYKRTYLLVSFTILAAILNTVLNFILVPEFSILGCVISTLIAQTTYLIIIVLVTNYIQKQTNFIPAKQAQDYVDLKLNLNKEKIDSF